MATSAACASGLQAAGAAFDLVRMGRQELVICGGSEELHPIVTGSFDILYATSSAYNDRPQLTPRPFDRDRDGLVCGEGAGVLVVEEHDRAVKRGAHIYGEILGYDTRGNGSHMSQSDRKTMALSMQAALAEARLAPTEVGYVNAHATGTLQGDAAEAQAINDIFGQKVPVSSLKGHLGHTLGASGPIELIACLKMMQQKIILPTKHLENIAEDCNCIQHVLEIREQPFRRFLKNSFAFGGINAAMVIAAI
jgi:3-oxoacyl-[acyl-carrier-protein] synthase II